MYIEPRVTAVAIYGELHIEELVTEGDTKMLSEPVNGPGVDIAE